MYVAITGDVAVVFDTTKESYAKLRKRKLQLENVRTHFCAPISDATRKVT